MQNLRASVQTDELLLVSIHHEDASYVVLTQLAPDASWITSAVAISRTSVVTHCMTKRPERTHNSEAYRRWCLFIYRASDRYFHKFRLRVLTDVIVILSTLRRARSVRKEMSTTTKDKVDQRTYQNRQNHHKPMKSRSGHMAPHLSRCQKESNTPPKRKRNSREDINEVRWIWDDTPHWSPSICW